MEVDKDIERRNRDAIIAKFKLESQEAEAEASGTGGRKAAAQTPPEEAPRPKWDKARAHFDYVDLFEQVLDLREQREELEAAYPASFSLAQAEQQSAN